MTSDEMKTLKSQAALVTLSITSEFSLKQLTFGPHRFRAKSPTELTHQLEALHMFQVCPLFFGPGLRLSDSCSDWCVRYKFAVTSRAFPSGKDPLVWLSSNSVVVKVSRKFVRRQKIVLQNWRRDWSAGLLSKRTYIAWNKASQRTSVHYCGMKSRWSMRSRQTGKTLYTSFLSLTPAELRFPSSTGTNILVTVKY